MKAFAVLAVLICAIYGVLHVRSAGWVFEDSTWRNGGAKRVGEREWTLYQMPTLVEMIRTIPNRHLTAWTFYVMPEDARIAHASNLAIHVLNAALLALLIQSLGWNGWMVGSIFLLHPLASQAVAYASGRSEMLAATAVLSTIWFATVSRERPQTRYIAFALCLLAGAMTKPTFIVVVFPILLWTVWHSSAHPLDIRSHWLPGLEYVILAVLSAAIPLSAAVLWRAQSHPEQIPIWRWAAVQSVGFWSLLSAAWIPWHLSIDHAWWSLPTPLQILALVSTIALLAMLAVDAIRGRSVVALGIGWWTLALLPRLLVRDTMGWMREHHAYLALMGMSIVIAHVVETSGQRLERWWIDRRYSAMPLR